MLRTIVVLALVAAPLMARADSQEQLAGEFSKFAGSDANSKSLVDGLRDGKQVTLSDGKTATTFTPPTGKMGNGNVKIALSLAQADLKKQGVTNPTPTQLKAELTKILQERADHKGWGVIAQERGFKVGDLMRADRAEKPERQARADRPDRPERPEHPEHTGRGPR